jgi:RNA polymerase sigma-70 factor (ECF subfamily)
MATPSVLRRPDQREALFDDLYEAHRQTLHAFLLGRTSDPDLALDLLQEAFVRAWRNLDTLLALPAHRQRAWLFATGRNLVIDQYRSRATRTAAHEALQVEARHDAPVSESAERVVERADELQMVEAAIQRLPVELRTVLVLQVLGEHTSAAIGEMLDRPAGTVRYQLSRARRLLAEDLQLLDAASGSRSTSGELQPLPHECEV